MRTTPLLRIARVGIRQRFRPEFSYAGDEIFTFRITAVSDLPDPKLSDYADALFAVQMKCMPLDSTDAEKDEFVISAYLPAFAKRVFQDSAYIGPWNRGTVRLKEFSEVPEMAAIQRVDTVGDLESPVFFAELIECEFDRGRALRPGGMIRYDVPSLDEQARLAMITGMAESLRAHDIELVVVPFPFKEEIVGGPEQRPGVYEVFGQRRKLDSGSA